MIERSPANLKVQGSNRPDYFRRLQRTVSAVPDKRIFVKTPRLVRLSTKILPGQLTHTEERDGAVVGRSFMNQKVQGSSPDGQKIAGEALKSQDRWKATHCI